MLATLAAGAVAAPAAAQQERQQEHAKHKHEGMVNIKPPPVYKPKFFTAAEYAALTELVDLIIPRTDTPGASDAGVPRIIDSGVRPQSRQAWRSGLALYRGLSEADQLARLERASREKATADARFFRLLKNATIDAYYSTREGLVTELGWKGNTFLSSFEGCTHPEHQS